MRGVWIGKFPSSLTRNIYSVASAKPVIENEIAFLTWVLNDGQSYLNQNGYFDLVYSERKAKTDLLTENTVILASSASDHPLRKALIALLAIAVGVFIMLWGYRIVQRKKSPVNEVAANEPPLFDQNSVMLPKGLYYDKSHTWIFMEKNGSVRVGMDDFLQHITGTVTRIKMKNRGEKISKGDPLFSIIQNGKKLTMNAPVSGTIISCNDELKENSSLINTSPYSEGWIYVIEPSNWFREIQFMIKGDKFSSWLNNEFIRLKDFLANSTRLSSFNPSFIVLQDGGAIKDNILEDLGPEVWEDFQTKFIDSSK
jgi:glycine cleavage system H lipoate-binding protein